MRSSEASRNRSWTEAEPKDINLACLEAEDLVLELADGAGLGVAERLGGLLHGADHGRGTTQHDLDIAGGGGETFLEKKMLGLGCAR